MKHDLPYGLRFSIISRAFNRQLDEQLLEKDLTGVQLSVLRELDWLENSGIAEVNQRDLEKAGRVTHPTMMEILKRLERKGFVSCRKSSLDRRSKCVASTAKARELQQELGRMDKDIFDRLCRGLSPSQRDELGQIMDIMLDNVFNSCHAAVLKSCEKGSDKLDTETCKEHKVI